jgi:hypothetical protein
MKFHIISMIFLYSCHNCSKNKEINNLDELLSMDSLAMQTPTQLPKKQDTVSFVFFERLVKNEEDIPFQ